MAYPPYDQLELPLLKLIYEQGGPNHELHATATYGPLAEHFGLSSEERSQTRDAALGDGRDEPFWNNMIQWARRKLNEKGYLSTAARGYWRLSPVGVKKAQTLSTGTFIHIVYPDELSNATIEGAKKAVVVNAYERSGTARQACIDHYGYTCSACLTNLESVYGERGKNFIHVHHIVPIASIGETYEIDPVRDLRPICPNCHAVIHRTNPPCTIQELQAFIKGKP